MRLSLELFAEFFGGRDTLERLQEAHPTFVWLEAALLLVSLILNLAWFWPGAAPRIAKGPGLPMPPVGWTRGLRWFGYYLFVFFGVMLLASGLEQAFESAWGPSEQRRVIVLTASLFCTSMGSLGLAWLANRRTRSESGLPLSTLWRVRSRRGALVGVAAFLWLILPVALVLGGTEKFYELIHADFDAQPVITLMEGTDQLWFVVFMSVSAVLIVPWVEEIFFRGILYTSLRDRLGMLPAMGISALLFALMHFHLPSVPPLFCLGVFFAWSVERSGSITSSVVAHALYNALNVAALWLTR